MSKIVEYLTENKELMLADLTRFVEAESPSLDKKLVDSCGQVLEEIFKERLGVEAVRFPQEERGDHLLFTVGTGATRILIAGHFDTVWDKGRLPIRFEDGKFYGPGVLDMKSGIIQSIWAVKAYLELGYELNAEIAFLCTTDEEVGSQTSRALIEEEAKKSNLVLVTEPPVAKTGALKTARKGVGIYQVKAKGVSSHAGNHHQAGISAIKELAHQIIKLEELTNYELGTTVNVGVVQGGTRSNVVPDEAEAQIDFRVETAEEADRMVSILENLSPIIEGIELEVVGELNRPPMERTEEIVALFSKAKEAAQEIGFALDEAAAGGGSDGNFTAYIGVPTLDGLGCLGEGPHAEYEHIIIDELPKRAALLSHLLMRL
ncbi:M20 family metallopeptidase [Bacillus sp. PS06]|uniref:M20 family metallopeptidase n=1 Tax=Bacillus sp. PS06 TaxID=2764176 RepID=UPI001785F580|nr:M20 family metallopeptidase [Bacillus sp. PS06]MBD8070803.1 M20 family metallopeptidase [Bacillus sp. PS06]